MEDLSASTLREIVRKRADVLASLRDTPAPKPALVERLDVSRSTVDRAIDALVDAGLVRRIDGEYHTTANGRLALAVYRKYVDTTDTLAEAAPLLDSLPTDVTVARSLLDAGDIRVAEPHAPENAITEAVRRLQSARELLVFSPVIKSNYIRPVHEQVRERDLDVQLVLAQSALASMEDLRDVTGAVDDLLSAESFSLYTTDRQLPFLLYVMRGDGTETVGITVHDDGGIVGSVVAEDPDAVEWGQARFEDVMVDAEQVPTSTFL